jgi:predicted polyphosphate/ATP-dependent NAD kinase
MRIGFILNPYAGVGGAMAMKGSDDVDVDTLLANGGQCLSSQRAFIALQNLVDEDIQWLTVPAQMGADILDHYNIEYEIVGELNNVSTTANDTERLVTELVHSSIDLLLFVGGDGTARNIVNALANANKPEQLTLGIPAGVKMHSGVFAVSPQAANRVLQLFLDQEVVSTAMQEVRDIDEDALRAGQLNSRFYGELLSPNDSRYVQQIKNTQLQNDEEVQAEIAASIVDTMEADTLYIIGCGTTPKAVMDELGLPNSLLGIDVVLGRQLIASDVTAPELEHLLEQHPYHPVKLLITAIGGQGHIIGRGNQQLSIAVLKRVGKAQTHILITPNKLAALEKRPLLIDSGNPALDKQWAGWVNLHTGYQQTSVYPLSDGVE